MHTRALGPWNGLPYADEDMAFITFLARHKEIAQFQLRGSTTLGRSMDCDIFIPDVFVSRLHCRFEQRGGNWHIVDGESRNGTWLEGRRLDTHLLKPGDTIEIGTIALRFNAGNASGVSHPAPFGARATVTELTDTVHAFDLRPSEFIRHQKARKAQWIRRVKDRLTEPADLPLSEPVVVIDTEPWRREEWAELDLEAQIIAGQELMTDWEPPIFSPKRNTVATATAAAPAATTVQPEMDSVDEEVEARVTLGRRLTPAPPAQPPVEVYDGVEIVAYTWSDSLRDSVRERYASLRDFAKLNPQLAAEIAIGIAVLLYAVLRYAPIDRGPHYYIPETTDERAALAVPAR